MNSNGPVAAELCGPDLAEPVRSGGRPAWPRWSGEEAKRGGPAALGLEIAPAGDGGGDWACGIALGLAKAKWGPSRRRCTGRSGAEWDRGCGPRQVAGQIGRAGKRSNRTAARPALRALRREALTWILRSRRATAAAGDGTFCGRIPRDRPSGWLDLEKKEEGDLEVGEGGRMPK